MGRLEKQIIIGALVLVGVLLSVVVFKGLKPRGGDKVEAPPLIVLGEIPLKESEVETDPKVDTNNGEASPWPVNPPRPPVKGGQGGKFEKVEEISLDPVPPKEDPKVKHDSPKPPLEPAVRRYTIKSGDTLSEIAQKELGSSKPGYVQDILDMNPGVTAQNIQPGESLILPARGSHQAKPSEASAKKANTALSAGQRSHKISSGDSLWKIARKYYGPGSEEKGIERIVAANAQLKDGKNSVLKIGQVLVIPE